MRYGSAQLRLAAWLSAASVVFGDAGRSYAEFDPNDFPPQAVLVQTEAEFRAAAAQTQTESITILVSGTVVVNNDTVVFPNSASIVKLVGIGDAPAIDFNLQWQGWGSSQNEVDGLRFESRQVVIHNLTFRNYNHRGGAIRATGPANGELELLSVSNCRFEFVGTTQFDHANDPATGQPYLAPPLADHVVFNHCIYATGHDQSHVAVKKCTFVNSIMNNRQWSRCLRISARSVNVFDNAFYGCGQPFDLGGPGALTNGTVFGNLVENPALVDDNGVTRRPAIATLYHDDHVAFMFNTFTGTTSQGTHGEVFIPWEGVPNPQRHLIDHNDYGGLTYDGFWAAAGGAWANWTSLAPRFDTHSVPPLHPPGADPGIPAVGYPASTILVSNEAELHAAAAQSRDRSVLNVLVSGTVAIDNNAFFFSDGLVRIVGIGADPTIDMDGIPWGGDETPRTIQNGLALKLPQAIVHGLTIRNYDTTGAAIKGHGLNNTDLELLSVSNCRFLDNGTTQDPIDIDPATGEPYDEYTIDDLVYNQSIGSHQQAYGHIGVTNCVFERCQLNNVAWSHCMYISARSVDVLNNTFRDSGHPFAVGSGVADASNNVFRNTVIDPAYVQNRHRELVAAWFAVLRAIDFDTYMFNSMAGMSRQPFFTSPPANDRNYVDFNDYSGLQYYGHFFGNTDGPNGHFDDWNQTWKLDIHSAAPQHVDWPGPHVVNVTAENGSVVLDPNATEFPTDYVVSLTAQPNPGYEFSNWSGDAAGDAPTITLSMDSDKNVIAEFSEIPSACGSGAFLPAALLAISIVKLVRWRRRRTAYRPQ